MQASLIESQIFMLDLQAARYLVDGVVPKQVGNEHPSGVPTNTYRTKDGYVNIAPIPYMWPQAVQSARPRGPDRSSGLRDARGAPQPPEGGQQPDSEASSARWTPPR